MTKPTTTEHQKPFHGVKVEWPGTGDDVRYWGCNKNNVGLYFKILGRGKKSVTADMRTPLGVEIVKRLPDYPYSSSMPPQAVDMTFCIV